MLALIPAFVANRIGGFNLSTTWHESVLWNLCSELSKQNWVPQKYVSVCNINAWAVSCKKKKKIFFLNGITKGRRENRRTTKLITVWIFTVHLKELEHKHIQTDKTLFKIVGGVFWTYRHTITLHTYCRLVLLYISLNQFFDQFCTPEQNPRSVPEGWQQDGEHHPVLSSGDG